LDCGGFRRLLRCLAIIGTTFAITWGNALAAPPQDTPGNSEHAPGQQKHESDEPRGPQLAPGQEKKEYAATTPAPNANATHRNTELRPAAKKPDRLSRRSRTGSTRYFNPQGKPKRNVPVVAETAPAASASGPGRSGVHKLTLCHNGHAITVDVHAAAAHLKHGDIFLPAGTKGRASCVTKHSRSSVRSSTTNATRVPSARDRDAVRTGSNEAQLSKRSAPMPAANSATTPDSVSHGVLGEQTTAAGTRNSGTPPVPTASAAQLPFTGSAVTRFLVAGLVLIALGCVLTLGGRGWLSRVCAAASDSTARTRLWRS
jgi:hypothetical protein